MATPPPPQNRACRLAPHTAQANHLQHLLPLLISRTLRLPGMSLLVAVQMYQFPVGVRVRPTHRFGFNVVALEFLTIDEVHATQPADPVLVDG